MIPARARFRLPLLLVLALPLACVNPFKPADPEPPDSSALFEDFHSPAAVLETMKAAIVSKTPGGASAWLHAFAESTQTGDRAYRCFYDGAVKQNWQTANSRDAPEPWDLSLERGLHTYVSGIRANLPYTFEWTEDGDSQKDDDPSAADTAQFHRHYRLRAVSTTSDTELIAVGFADLSFQRTSGRWSIYRWNDRLDPGYGVNPPNSERAMSFWRLESLIRR